VSGELVFEGILFGEIVAFSVSDGQNWVDPNKNKKAWQSPRLMGDIQWETLML
jgi:hypothetical protein